MSEEKEVKIDAKYDGDTKRCHRYKLDVEAGKGIFGSIYVSKEAQVPDKLIVNLKG